MIESDQMIAAKASPTRGPPQTLRPADPDRNARKLILLTGASAGTWRLQVLGFGQGSGDSAARVALTSDYSIPYKVVTGVCRPAGPITTTLTEHQNYALVYLTWVTA
jgi:hypothetical protein